MVIFKTLFHTMYAGDKSFTINDPAITDDSIIEVYPSVNSIALIDVSVSGNIATITFDNAVAEIVPVAVFINNLEGAYEPVIGPIPTTDVIEDDKTQAEINHSLDDRVTALEEAGGNTEKVELTKAEYDALPDSKLTDGKLYFINDWSQGGNAIIYDDNEHIIGSWFDKPLYSRVISGAITSNSTYTVLNVENIDIHKYNGYFTAISGNRGYIGYLGASFLELFRSVSGEYRLYHPNQTSEGATYQLTIEYTKTTD